MYKKRKNSWDKHYDFIILDTICLLTSFLLACLLYDGDLKLYHSFEYRNMAATMMILHICVIALGNHYSGILRRGYYLELKAVIRYNMVLMAAILAYLFIMKRSQIYSRKIFLLFFVINVLLDYVVHQLLKCYLIKTNVASREQQYMLLVTTKNHMQKMVEKHKCVGEARCIGLFGALEMVKNKETREPLQEYGIPGTAMPWIFAEL